MVTSSIPGYKLHFAGRTYVSRQLHDDRPQASFPLCPPAPQLSLLTAGAWDSYSSYLTGKDMHTKMAPNYHFQGRCSHSLGFWLPLVFLTNLSLATLLESLPASPEPFSPSASMACQHASSPGRDGKPCRAHCANIHSYSFITFSMRTSTLIKTGPSSLTHFPLPITN